MKIHPFFFSAFALFPLSLPLSAAIVWEGPNGSTSYNTSYTVGDTVTVDATGDKFAGIFVNFTSTTDGTFAVNAAGRQLNFTLSETLSAGSSFTMDFLFSHQLGSGDGARSAVQFNAGSSLNMDVEAAMYGGGMSLQDYWGTSAEPTAQHKNGGIIEFQDIFISDPTDYIDPDTGTSTRTYGAGPSSAVFTGFTDANTAVIAGGQDFPDVLDYDGTDPVSGDSNFRFHIVGPQRNSTDYSFSQWQFTVTALEDIPAGSNFLYTYEGIIVGPSPLIPEPTSSALLGLSALTLKERKIR